MTLTREEILTKEPGTKLDRWIQEHIFNWIPWAEQRGDYLVVTFQKPGEREPYKGSQNWKSQMDRYSVIQFLDIDPMKHVVYGDKNWSTDISAAWEVESIFDQDTTLREDYAIEIHNVLGLMLHEPTTLNNIYQFAHATPEQRCKAALLAVLNL